MSTIKNQVQLIGNIGNTPETITFNSGKKAVRLSMVTNEYYRKDCEKVQDTQWHNLIARGNQADLIEKYVGKGKEIAIQGKLTSRSYETQTGKKRHVTEVVVQEIIFLGNQAAE